MVEHHRTGWFDVLMQVFFQCFGAVNEFLFSHGAVMIFFFIFCSNKCIILLSDVKKLIISFGALTAVIFTTAITLIGCC
jgi:hypothetical protein